MSLLTVWCVGVEGAVLSSLALPPLLVFFLLSAPNHVLVLYAYYEGSVSILPPPLSLPPQCTPFLVFAMKLAAFNRAPVLVPPL